MRIKSRSKRVFTATSSSSSSGEEVEGEIVIRKGPWKADEDEVLLKHVSKCGPRDWSSLLSKGLLQRTGKSCRLRWVNKLRPDLKNGCKFSADEERIVIELQSQLGNKWAKIATYLPGRTDNDVKNFWSSRQKRLARLLLNSPKSKHNKSLSSQGLNLDPPTVESSSNAESSNSLHYTPLAMEVVPLQTVDPNDEFGFPPNASSLSLNPVDQQNNTECSILHQQNLPFPEPPSDLQLLDFDFLGAFPRPGDAITSEGVIVGEDDDRRLMQLSTEMADYLGPLQDSSFSDPKLGGEIKPEERGFGNDIVFDQNSLNSDGFFDDLPSDIFDQMEQIPSPPPSDW